MQKTQLMKDQKHGVVFIHGAGLGKFIWNDIKPGLNYPSLMVEFPNRNSGDMANSQLSFEEYIVEAISEVERFEKEKLIVVAHSIGGLIGLRIAEHFKEKISGFVGIGAAIPANGNSFISCLPFPQKLVVPIIMRLAGTKPPKSAIENGLCNGLNPEQTQTVVESFTAESKYLYTEKSKSKIPDTKKLYVALNNDNEFAIPVQKRMAENLNCDNITVIDSGHLPMMSMPEKISEILNEFIHSCVHEDY